MTDERPIGRYRDKRTVVARWRLWLPEVIKAAIREILADLPYGEHWVVWLIGFGLVLILLLLELF
jgi:hypothetical protein